MNTSLNQPSRDEQLEAILVAWLEAAESDSPPDPQEWLARHPEFAEELREFFAAQQEVQRLSTPLRDELTAQGGLNGATLAYAAGGSTSAGAALRSSRSALGHVRYFGDYELLEEVARGGMGVVYRARQSGLSRIVALKMILGGRLAGEDDVERFRAEAEAAASLDHPNIVPVFEVGEHEGQHYFSMGFVEGNSLADRLRDGPLPPRDAARIARQIAEAVAYAHGKGVIHRDLKPANILLSRPEILGAGARMSEEGPLAKITDFGLAKRIEADRGLTATGQILGTPSYMPPEQASGRVERVKEPADVYSLGAILYAMLTGRPPFQADNPLDTLVQVMEEEPVAPRQLNPKVPRDLETICLKCLEKEPARRYSSAAALAEDLDHLLRDEPIRARRLGGPERAWRWLRKQGRSVALAAATIAATLVIGLVSLAVWYSYSQWRLGELSLDTDRPPLVAEILDAEGNRAAPVTTLPTSAPLALPAGDYLAQIRGEGRLSQTYHVAVTRGAEALAGVNLEDQTLFPTMEIERSYDLVSLDGRTELALLTDKGVSLRNDGFALQGAGSAAQEVWTTTLAGSSDPVLQAAPGFRWPWSPVDGSNNEYDGYDKFDLRPQFVGSRRDELPGVWSEGPSVRTSLDLDGDGADDLLLAAHHQAWLLALSGKTGTPLWLAARGSDVQGKGDPQMANYRNMNFLESTVIGLPEIAGDLNGDAAPDLIATFVERNPTSGFPNSGPTAGTRWVEAVSGKTGDTIWRYDLPEAAFQIPPGREPPHAFRFFTSATGWSSGGGGFNLMGREAVREAGSRTFERSGEYIFAPDAARVVPLYSGGRTSDKSAAEATERAVVVLAGSQLIVLSAATGQPLAPPHDLGFPALRPLVFADTTGDGAPHAVFVGESLPTTPNVAPASSQLAVYSLNPIQKLWKREQRPRYSEPPFPRHPRFRWPLAADLDGDGADEVLVPADPNPPTPWTPGWQTPTGWLEALDGRTGKQRWIKRLRTLDMQIDHFAVGPDVNGDGHKEVFVATLLYAQSELYVDCLSGADGQTLWWSQRMPENKRQQTFQHWISHVTWWGIGADGWPQLLVAVQPENRSAGLEAAIHLFSAGGKHTAVVGSGMADVHLADADGDGHDELFSYNPWIGRDRGGRLDGHRGGSPELWRRLGGTEWSRAGDFDGDGVAELVCNEAGANIAAISGTSGAALWRRSLPQTLSSPLFVTLEDLNGDEVPDLLAAPKSNIGRMSPFEPFQLLSGKDGRRLWSADIEVQSAQHPLMQAAAPDLDGDGTREVVLIGNLAWDWVRQNGGYSSSDGNLWLAVLSGRTGALRWKQPLSGAGPDGVLTMTPTQFSRPVYFGEMRIAFGDLNGDEVSDLLLPAEIPGQPGQVEVRALDGKDGSALWSRPLKSTRGQLEEIVTAAPCIGDLDGDGRNEALVLEFFDDPQNPAYGNSFARLTALDGAGGQRWQWESKRFFNSSRQFDESALRKRPQVHLLRIAGQAQPVICVNLWGNGSDQVLPEEGPLDDSTASAAIVAVLDSSGRPLSRIPVNGSADFAAWPLDADGEGSEELAILSRKDGLQVVRPGAKNEVVWRQEAGRYSLDEIAGILPREKNRAATIVVRDSEQLMGFAAGDGRLLWQVSPPRPRQGRSSFVVESIPLAPAMMTQPGDEPPAAAAASSDPHGDAAFVTAYRYGDVTLAGRALPVGGGRSFSPRTVAAPAPSGSDPRWTRPLPWAWAIDLNSPAEARRTIYSLAYAIMICVALVFLPGWYLGSLVRRRAFSLKALFVAPVLVGLALVALSAPAPMHVESAPLLQKLAMGFVMLPVVLVVFSLCRAAVRRRWRRIAVWSGIALATTAGLAAVMIAIDQIIVSDALPYSWEGWPAIFLLGVYGAGWFLIPAAAVEWAMRRVKQPDPGGRVA